jgi:hypothetical protein
LRSSRALAHDRVRNSGQPCEAEVRVRTKVEEAETACASSSAAVQREHQRKTA